MAVGGGCGGSGGGGGGGVRPSKPVTVVSYSFYILCADLQECAVRSLCAEGRAARGQWALPSPPPRGSRPQTPRFAGSRPASSAEAAPSVNCPHRVHPTASHVHGPGIQTTRAPTQCAGGRSREVSPSPRLHYTKSPLSSRSRRWPLSPAKVRTTRRRFNLQVFKKYFFSIF